MSIFDGWCEMSLYSSQPQWIHCYLRAEIAREVISLKWKELICLPAPLLSWIFSPGVCSRLSPSQLSCLNKDKGSAPPSFPFKQEIAPCLWLSHSISLSLLFDSFFFFPHRLLSFHQSPIFLPFSPSLVLLIWPHFFVTPSSCVHLCVGNTHQSQSGCWMSGLIRGEAAVCHPGLSCGNQEPVAWRKVGKGHSLIGDFRSVT